jgi:hypothetical protein
MCIDQIESLISFVFKNVWNFANSTIITTLIGAFSGAYGGYLIVEKNKKRESLLSEIRNTNAAITVAFQICTSYLSLKQHVKPLKENFYKSCQDFEDFDSKKKQKKIPMDEKFPLKADLEFLEKMMMPIDVLQKLNFEKISLNGLPLFLTTTLIRAIQSLNNFIEKRNQLIELYSEQYKANLLRTSDDKFFFSYFGLKDNSGNIDKNYPDCVDFIYEGTDECIIFSKFLCEELIAHGEQLQKKFGKKSPGIYKPNFQEILDADLMPDETKYASLKSIFAESSKDME